MGWRTWCGMGSYAIGEWAWGQPCGKLMMLDMGSRVLNSGVVRNVFFESQSL